MSKFITNLNMARFPKAELMLETEHKKKTYEKYLNAEDMILLIKDKFINWKELVHFLLLIVNS